MSTSIIQQIQAGEYPDLEFLRFTRRNNTVLIPSSQPAKSRFSVLRKVMDRVHAALAYHVARGDYKHSAIVTSAEDVGLAIALAFKLSRRKTPVLSEFHGHQLGSKKFLLMLPVLASLDNFMFLTLSRSLQLKLTSEYKFPKSKCANVSFGVDTEFFKPAPATQPSGPRNTPLVVSAGAAYRDYATLIEAMAGLDAELKIAAASAWVSIDTAKLSTSLPDNVEFVEDCDYLQLRDLYRNASFVVVPMHLVDHACGYAVMSEAMAMGKAVIATRLPAPCDFFLDGVHGFYVEPGDVEGLRAAMTTLLENPTLARNFGLEARRQMELNYSLDAFCERIEGCVAAFEAGRAAPDHLADRTVYSRVRGRAIESELVDPGEMGGRVAVHSDMLPLTPSLG